MLERCDDGQGDALHGALIGGLFAGEKMDASRQAVRRDPLEGEEGRQGRACRSTATTTSPALVARRLRRGSALLDVTIRTQDGRTCARLPRVYGDSPATVRNPATLLPALSRKTHAWTDSTIRDDFDNQSRAQCLFDRFGSVFPQCGLMVFPGVVIVSR